MEITPQEFARRYGHPRVRTYIVPVGGQVDIPRDDNRYLLGFICASAGMVILPVFEDATFYEIPNWPSNALPLIFTHALHGSLVNMAWRIQQPGVVVENRVCVVEGVMVEIASRKRKAK